MAASAQIARLNPWHNRFALWLIAHGETKGWGKKAAAEFGVTQAWLSTVYHSDAFQDYYKGLRAEHTATLIHSISDKLNGAAGQALDILQEKLELEGPSLPFDTILETVDVLTKRALPAQSKNETNIQVALVSKEELAAFRDQMRKRRGEATDPIELTAVDVTPTIEAGDHK
jgi:hypothetical protein